MSREIHRARMRVGGIRAYGRPTQQDKRLVRRAGKRYHNLGASVA